jgi:hypothetical protein
MAERQLRSRLQKEREIAMPRDPSKFRQNALRCADLALTTNDKQLKIMLSGLSKEWMKMAIEVERSQPNTSLIQRSKA